MEVGDFGAADVEELGEVESIESLLGGSGGGLGEAGVEHLFDLFLRLDLSSESKRGE